MGAGALFGHDPTEGLVAVEFLPPAGIELWLRRPGGETRSERAPADLFLLLSDREPLAGLPDPPAIEPLAGEAAYRWLARFPSWPALQAAVRRLETPAGEGTAAPPPFFYSSDPVHQTLLMSGRTLFRGMHPDDLRLLAVDIEVHTAEPYRFPLAERESDRVIGISLADGRGWEAFLSGRELAEPELLRRLGEIIAERDPDCLVGHNVFRFDLEYLEARARRHGIALAWGRDGSELRGHPSRLMLAERAIGYRKYEVRGRHIVDTWILAQHYDVVMRDLPGFGLKAVARHLGVARPDRVYLDGRDIGRAFREDHERFAAYALDDARETLAVARLLMPAFFVQAQVFPFSFQNVMLRGTATRIDSLFLRDYLRERQSVPAPMPPAELAGGYTGIRFEGVARRVLHCDVASLYPSLMLAEGIAPASDVRGAFPAMLGHLTRLRLEAKRRAREAPGERDRRYWNAYQNAMKILINSFFGYLAFPLGHFNDFAQANRLTARGRELIQRAVDWLEREGCRVIEVDTDGIYFSPPAASEEAEDRLLERLAATFPPGLRLELDGRYRAMFSYKMKNYALLDEEGRLTLKGSSLTSRGIEPYLRDALAAMVRLALEERAGEIGAMLGALRAELAARLLPAERLARTETLRESPEAYREKVRRGERAVGAAYQLALASGRAFAAGDQVSYYVTGRGARVAVHERARLVEEADPERPDYNVEYYLAKLDDLARKFGPPLGAAGAGPAEQGTLALD